MAVSAIVVRDESIYYEWCRAEVLFCYVSIVQGSVTKTAPQDESYNRTPFCEVAARDGAKIMMSCPQIIFPYRHFLFRPSRISTLQFKRTLSGPPPPFALSSSTMRPLLRCACGCKRCKPALCWSFCCCCCATLDRSGGRAQGPSTQYAGGNDERLAKRRDQGNHILPAEKSM